MNHVDITFEFETAAERRKFFNRVASNTAMMKPVVVTVGTVSVEMWMNNVSETTRRKKEVVFMQLTEKADYERRVLDKLKE